MSMVHQYVIIDVTQGKQSAILHPMMSSIAKLKMNSDSLIICMNKKFYNNPL